MISEILLRSQINRITFVMVDVTNAEVPGLGAGYVLQVSKNGGAFNPAAGAGGEIGSGWYYYDLTAAECNTVGPLSVIVNGAGCVQQNLEYVVMARNAGCIEYTYTVTDSITLLPVSGVEVWVTTDLAGTNVIWNGTTNALGIALDDFGHLPCLDAQTYYFWKHRVGYIDDDNPDTEVVS